MGGTRLVFVAFRVRDLEASARLYRDAFGIPLHEGQPPQPHAEVSWTEGAYLHFALFPADDGPAATNSQVGFVVDDVEAAHVRAAAAGAAVVYGPRDEPWGRTAAYRDLDGNLVSLTQRARPLRVAGVDIAGGGWAVVVLEGDKVVEAYRCERFAQALRNDVEVIAVDVPIGIPESGSRPADNAARRFVGKRGSSVFPTPVRAVLETSTYEKARERAVELTGKSLAKQTYSLAPYIGRSRRSGVPMVGRSGVGCSKRRGSTCRRLHNASVSPICSTRRLLPGPLAAMRSGRRSRCPTDTTSASAQSGAKRPLTTERPRARFWHTIATHERVERGYRRSRGWRASSPP